MTSTFSQTVGLPSDIQNSVVRCVMLPDLGTIYGLVMANVANYENNIGKAGPKHIHVIATVLCCFCRNGSGISV